MRGTYCCICFNGITPENCYSGWDLCGECGPIENIACVLLWMSGGRNER